MKIFTSPEGPCGPIITTVFLAGPIEMGNLNNWQQRAIDALPKRVDVGVYNPRPNIWDEAWIDGSPEMVTQINWELDQIEDSHVIFFYFHGDYIPSSVMFELGLATAWSKRSPNLRPTVIVTVEPTYYQRSSVIEMCERGNIVIYNTFEAGLMALIEEIESF